MQINNLQKLDFVCNVSVCISNFPLLCTQSAHSHNPSHQSHNTMIVTSSSSSSSTTPHRVVVQQGYDGMMNKGVQYQPGMPLSVVPAGGQYQGNMSQGKWTHSKMLHLWPVGVW